MTDTPKIAAILPHKVPAADDARLLLFALRRIAVHGMSDAFAVNAMLTGFGLRYRRPLVLLRALLVEMARAAQGNVVVAPCCAPRMTRDEDNILAALADPACAAERLGATLGTPDCLRAIDTARALSDTLAGMGRPIRL